MNRQGAQGNITPIVLGISALKFRKVSLQKTARFSMTCFRKGGTVQAAEHARRFYSICHGPNTSLLREMECRSGKNEQIVVLNIIGPKVTLKIERWNKPASPAI
jgi:hypothetical protein